jgi:hypothetical protein
MSTAATYTSRYGNEVSGQPEFPSLIDRIGISLGTPAQMFADAISWAQANATQPDHVSAVAYLAGISPTSASTNDHLALVEVCHQIAGAA